MPIRLEHQLHAGVKADEAIWPQPDRVPLEAIVADLLKIRFGDNPGRPGGGGGVERQEVRPGGMEHETEALGIDDLDRLHPVVQQLGRGALIAEEAEVHILGGEGSPVVEHQALPQLEFVYQPIGALRPGLRQAGGQVIAGEGFDQRVMEGIQKHKGCRDPGRLGRIEIRGSDGGVEGDGQLSFWLACRRGIYSHQRNRRAHKKPTERASKHTVTSSPHPSPSLPLQPQRGDAKFQGGRTLWRPHEAVSVLGGFSHSFKRRSS